MYERRRSDSGGGSAGGSSRKWMKELSSLANVVLHRCSRIIFISGEELQRKFEEEVPGSTKHPSKYARNLLEYCCFKALALATQDPDYLNDKEFRRLTFDMMLAWEAPGATQKPSVKVDVESTVGLNAFVRLGPAISGVADKVCAHNQFNALTATSGGHLSFFVFDKYLGELDKAIKAMKNKASSSQLANLDLRKGERVIEVDGTMTTQPVLQHIGISTWPGRLTLTDHALYFESIGVVSYNKPKKMDLSSDLQQVVKPEMTGPWGARLFDKAVSYKSSLFLEPVVMEFPEFIGHSRRDYWFAVMQEILSLHHFVRKFELKAQSRMEAVSRAVLGIARVRATRETIRGALPSRPESLLTFSGVNGLPEGDSILEALAESFTSQKREVLEGDTDEEGWKSGSAYGTSAASTLTILGYFNVEETRRNEDDESFLGDEFLIGDLTPLEKAVLQSHDDSSIQLDLAEVTIDGVKVDGISTNLAVLKELIQPLNAFVSWISALQSWNDPFKTSTFLIISSYIIIRNLLGYVIPFGLICFASFMIWFRYSGCSNIVGEVKVSLPPMQSKVEQLFALQQGLSEMEILIQTCNIFLLKIRALIMSTLPQATDQIAIACIILAVLLAILPLNIMLLLMFWDIFTRHMPLRQASTERFTRRLEEWWYRVPVVPVHLIKSEEENKRK